MKTLNWAKIPNSKIQGTVFDDIDCNDEDLKIEKIEKLFSRTVAAPKKVEKVSAPPKDVKKTFVEPKVLQNTSIFLRTIKMSLSDFTNKMLNVEEEFITAEIIEKLMDNLPSDNSVVDMIKSWMNEDESNTFDKLERVDQFYLRTSEIPHLKERLEISYLKQTFHQKLDNISATAVNYLTAVTSLQDTKDKIVQLLRYVLAVGNFINFGTRSGNSRGFFLRSLSNLRDVKGSTGSSNLLHFIAEQFPKDHPDCESWTSELQPLSLVTKISLDAAEDELRELDNSLSTAEKHITKITKTSDTDTFKSDMEPILAEFRMVIDLLKGNLDRVKQDLITYVEQFGEKSTNLNDFLKLMVGFIEEYENAIRQNQVAKQRQERERKKRHLAKKMKLAQKEAQDEEQGDKEMNSKRGRVRGRGRGGRGRGGGRVRVSREDKEASDSVMNLLEQARSNTAITSDMLQRRKETFQGSYHGRNPFTTSNKRDDSIRGKSQM
eukprot:TRINITY_DN4247_c0_g1_i1.p1 TRINITY_DN4247_c0_g1~~TRINITY_DN4247_c0_g1_i1.p1  ORF type:complete len:557 (-),score=136.32 TRINITY_DN4247_c0_g1_i1:8-1480(-)